MPETKEFIKLPDDICEETALEPIIMVLYGAHKLGKTSILTALTRYKLNNSPLALFVDLQSGAAYEKGVKLVVERTLPLPNKIIKFISILEALENYRETHGKNKYHIGILDPITELSEWIPYYATVQYMQSNIGKKWNRREDGTQIWNYYDKDFQPVTEVLNNATSSDGRKGSIGWHYIRIYFNEMIDRFCSYFDKVVLVAHTKEAVEEDGGTKAKSTELDLIGKMRQSIPRQVDIVGKLFALKDERLISFAVDSNDGSVGSRCKYLNGREIVMSRAVRNTKKIIENIEFYWEEIYPETLKNCTKF